MAESFNNYLTGAKYNVDQTRVIVPRAGSSIDSEVGVGSRLTDAVTQLHSIYVAKEISGNHTDDPITYASFITISIYDYNTQKTYAVAQNVMVLPHSSFYIEKAITLTPQQELRLTYTTANSSSSGTNIYTVCSSVDIS